jgi:hypothetical protein
MVREGKSGQTSITSMKVEPAISWPSHFLNVLHLNAVTMAVNFQHEFWRGQTFKP